MVTITSPNLTESNVNLMGVAAAGQNVQISDKTYNAGNGAAGTSWTRIYLNKTNARGGTLLATRSIPSLGAMLSSEATSLATLPLNIIGAAYVVACANDTGSVVEYNPLPNCTSTQVTVQGADLALMSASFPTIAAASTTIQATDTTANSGFGSSSTSWTRFYLNKTPTKGGTIIGTRTVPGIWGHDTQSVGTTNLAIPSNTAAGGYFVIACANDTNSVPETNFGNNCGTWPLIVVPAINSLSVDANAGVDTNNYTCAAGSPCQTITHALAIALPDQVVIAKPGVYTEQVQITKNVILTSSTPYGATIQAPTNLVPDPTDGATSLVWIGSNATNVFISNMTIQGPGPGSCGSLIYGIFATTGTTTITGNKVLSIRDEPYAGCWSGVAIGYGAQGAGYAAKGTVTNNFIFDYQLAGIVVDGPGTSVAVNGNTVTGQGKPGINGQNGIQISRGANATLLRNTVTLNLYGSDMCQSSDGILLYDVAGGVSLSANNVYLNDEALGIYSDSAATPTNATVMGNTFSSNRYSGVHIDANSTGNLVELNTIGGNGYGGAGYDELDETGSWTSPNSWGTDPSNYNILRADVTQFLGPVGCTWLAPYNQQNH
jgi:parallel beta-helix repeat protein